jgi:protein-tyrosine phosphatase
VHSLPPRTPTCWTAPAARLGAGQEPVAHVLHRVQPDFLQAAFDALEHDHGGLEAYLREGIGLDAVARKELQRLLLEP